MTMNERKVESIRKEIEKYTKSLERYESIEAKKFAKCEKLGCADWTREDLRNAYGDRNGNLDKINAWFDYDMAKDNVKETKEKVKNARARLEEAMPKAEADRESRREGERIEQLEEKAFKVLSWKDYFKAQEEFRRWLEALKADCLKDGVKIENYSGHFISGKTKSDKQFAMYLNEGWTERSDHCYTLYIDGKAIFTSGLFRTAYQLLRR